jgi:[methyl-Co(III) methanol-specific corrinoid protein]:coenzyme M methyltransferase
MSSRDDILAILRGERIGRLPVFSGLPCLTTTGLQSIGVRYHDAHTDATRMAAAAASTHALYDFESAVVPFDLCVEAEALGCAIDFQSDVELLLPPVVHKPLELGTPIVPVTLQAGRIPLVAAAIRQLKVNVGRELAIGAWVAGPFTLAWQLFGAEAWLSSLAHTDEVQMILDATTEFVARIAQHYRQAGADFITVHEMGGSPQAIGPHVFRRWVKPALTRLFAQLPTPNILSICGDTNAIVMDMAACGARALHVDQRNDLARTRRVLGDDVILLGNLAPVELLCQGTPRDIVAAVHDIAHAGANAIWPGCDLWPEIPDENMRALLATARALNTETGRQVEK